jgi:hypothetical protein
MHDIKTDIMIENIETKVNEGKTGNNDKNKRKKIKAKKRKQIKREKMK